MLLILQIVHFQHNSINIKGKFPAFHIPCADKAEHLLHAVTQCSVFTHLELPFAQLRHRFKMGVHLRQLRIQKIDEGIQ